MVTLSIGSNVFPVFSHFLVTISGGVIDNSNPSLLIRSINTARWRSPLPFIVIKPPSPLPSNIYTFKATSFSASFNNLSLIYEMVNLVPSLPYNGLLLIPIWIYIIGGSIGIDGITTLCPISLSVCDTSPS